MVSSCRLRRLTAVLIAVLLVFAPASALADRTQLKPGINSYSPQQDIQLGRQAAQEVMRKKQMCNDAKVDAYLTKIGQRLVQHLNTGGADYPWEFHCVNDKTVNAFALPGGFVFVNRGAIEAADNEAQLAGIMAHELAHVALRHGTNQLTKAKYIQAGTGIFGVVGGVIGGLPGAAVSGVGELTSGSILLRYSRHAETQADVMGTQDLYDSGYDPRALAAFFENLNASTAQTQNPPEFFSDHPNPDHRIERIQEEIRKMGGASAGAEKDSPEFEAIKREVMALPAPVKGRPANAKPGNANPPPFKVENPSLDVTAIGFEKASLAYPANWKLYTKRKSMLLVPSGGVVDTGNGQAAVACGMIGGVADVHDKHSDNVLRENTRRLLDALQHENEGMQIQHQPSDITVNGVPALATVLRSDSPAGGAERDWVISAIGHHDFYYFVFVAPESEYPRFDKAFQEIVQSVQFR
jgi:Zn-dependent protease with chaperone function